MRHRVGKADGSSEAGVGHLPEQKLGEAAGRPWAATRPAGDRKQHRGLSASIQARKCIDDFAMSLRLDRIADGQKQKRVVRYCQLLPEPIIGFLLEIGFADAVGKHREIAKPNIPDEIDVAISLGVEHQMIELPEDARKLLEILFEIRLIKT